MKGQITFLISLMLFSAATFSLTPAIIAEVPKVATSETIYIRADGLIDPPTSSIITLSNATYAFIADTDGSIVVEKTGITINGFGYTLRGQNVGNGIYLKNISDVIINDLRLDSFKNGISMEQASNSTINGNEITKCKNGVFLVSTINNTISQNNLTGNTYDGIILSSACNFTRIFENTLALNGEDGIEVLTSHHNSFAKNNITKNGNGIRFGNSTYNTIEGNVITNSYAAGIASDFSQYNTIDGNTISKNIVGIILEISSDHNISQNIISNNFLNGAHFDFSSKNTIFNNTIMGNVGRAGISLDFSNQNNITSNCLMGNPRGVSIKDATDNSVICNNITKNGYGVYTEDYTQVRDNSIVENNLVNNSCGVRLGYEAENNRIIYNNFMSNGKQVSLATNALMNCWNNEYPEGGNYWSDYNGTDCSTSPLQNETGSDGIGDTPYILDVNNTDHYPLKGLFSHFTVGPEYGVHTICNSSISGLQFDGKTFHLDATGYDGTACFCRICIPTALMNIPYKVFVNGTEVSHSLLLSSNETHSYLYFNFTHSTQEIVIIPEGHIFSILAPLVMTTLLIIDVCKRRRSALLR